MPPDASASALRYSRSDEMQINKPDHSLEDHSELGEFELRGDPCHVKEGGLGLHPARHVLAISTSRRTICHVLGSYWLRSGVREAHSPTRRHM